MKLDSCSVLTREFICGASEAGAAFAICNSGESLHTCYLKDGSAKEIQKFIPWIFFFLLLFPKKKLIHMHLTVRGKFSVQYKVT